MDEVRLEDEAEGDPRQEALEGVERHDQEGLALGVGEDELAELIDGGELLVQGL